MSTTMDVPWDPHFNAHSQMEIPVVGTRTPDPPVVLQHRHDYRDGEGLPSVPSTARTPLQGGDGSRTPAERMANELSKKLYSLQLHRDMDPKEEPSTRGGSGPGGSLDLDPCKTLETKAVIDSPVLADPVKLPVPPSSMQMPSFPGKVPDQPDTPVVPKTVLASAEDALQDEGVLPPPALHVLEEEADCGPWEAPIAISLGSVGHPRKCRSPCKYARRKGGCKNGMECLNCHQCKWARDRPNAMLGLVDSFSAGSASYPENSGQPCESERRSWRTKANDDKDYAPVGEAKMQLLLDGHVDKDVPVVPTPTGLPAWVQPTGTSSAMSGHWPSIGSQGHPHTCAGLGCKYHNKARGCKDGHLCTRCHFCRWNRYEKQNGGMRPGF